MRSLQSPLSSCGHILDLSDASFGELRRSDGCLNRPDVLRERMERDGYLYLPGFFDRDDVMAVRVTLTRRLGEQGLLDPAFPPSGRGLESEAADRVQAGTGPKQSRPAKCGFRPAPARLLRGLLRRSGEAFRFHLAACRRAWAGTNPHCDLVYMGRGTHNLLTCWIPYGDVPLELGGLMILEDSHHKSDRVRV